MVEEGQRDPEFETILDMVDPNRCVVTSNAQHCLCWTYLITIIYQHIVISETKNTIM